MSDFRPLDPDRALGRISHPVAVITVNDGRNMNGMTAAWLTRISSSPPILCVSISPKRHTWSMMASLEHFGVSLLGKGQERIGMLFGTKSGRDADKFALAGMKPFMAAHDIPLIPGSLAGLVCRRVDAVEMGDHWAVFGEVVEAWEGPERKPLNWHGSRYLE